MPTCVYFHICCINNWEEVVGRILRALRESGLYDALTEIRCAVLGRKTLAHQAVLHDDKLRIVFHSEDLSLREVPLLNRLHEDSRKEDFYVVILFYRNIFLRAIGIFISRCAADERFRRGGESLMRQIESAVEKSDYAHFRNALASLDFPEAFRVYVGALKDVYARNAQTLPQARLLEDFNVPTVDYFVEVEHNHAFFRITNCRFPFDATHRSNRAIKESLMLSLRGNRRLQSAIRDMYADDIRFFGRHNLRVDEF